MAHPRITLANNVTTNTTATRSSIRVHANPGPTQDAPGLPMPYTMWASLTGTGAVSVDVEIEVSDDDSSYETHTTFSLSGTGTASRRFRGKVAASYIRVVTTNISGTGASLDVNMEYQP